MPYLILCFTNNGGIHAIYLKATLLQEMDLEIMPFFETVLVVTFSLKGAQNPRTY
jgi:hypothetical protein